MSGQLHATAALHREKEPPTPTGKKAGYASEPVWTPSLPLPGIEH